MFKAFSKVKLLILSMISAPFVLTGQHFGEANHPMNKLTPNREVLQYWKANTPEEIELYDLAYGILSESKKADYLDLLTHKTYNLLLKKNPVQLLGGPMLGNLSQNRVSIWFRTAQPSKVQIVVSSKDTILRSKAVYTQIETDLTGIIKLEELNASTFYSYTLIINDSISVTSDTYFFKTAPRPSDKRPVRLAFGSCPHRWGLGNKKLLNAIKKRSPTALVLLGDIAVQDRNNHLGMHRADYLLRDFQSAWRDFTPSIPIYASWDDHDYFANDVAGIPKGYSQQDRSNVRQIFMNSWVNPSYGLHNEGIFFKTKIGFVELVMTDNRYFRSGEKGSFLGETQMDWLKRQISNCKSPFLVLSSGSMWSDFVSNGKDSWGVNDPEGREEIFELIEKNNISGVLLISGDRHGARGFTIQRDSGLQLYEFEVGSLGARVGPPKTKAEWTSQLYGIDGTFAFGELTFDNIIGQEQVVFRLINEDGNILYTKSLLLKNMVQKTN